jgi:biopolymer transport protein TolR
VTGGTSRRGAPIEGINVTPLVDIVLILLVVFIVTAKLTVSEALPLELPTVAQSEEVSASLSLEVPREGLLRINGADVQDARLVEVMRHAFAEDPKLNVVVYADKAVPHGRVLQVLDSLKAASVSRVAFGTNSSNDTDAKSDVQH